MSRAPESSSSDGDLTSNARHAPSRQPATSVLLADTDDVRLDLYEMWLETDFDVRTAASPDELLETLDGTVTVVFLGAGLLSAEAARLGETIRTHNPSSRTLRASDGGDRAGPSNEPYDLCLQEPVFRDEFRVSVERLTRRALYDDTLRRYYDCSTTIAGLEVRHTPEQLDGHDRYDDLNRRVSVLRARLDDLVSQMDERDLSTVLDSIRPDVEFPTEQEAEQSAENKYRPDDCPRCGLTWGVDHGHRLGQGYARLAAFVWECRYCHTVQSIPNPSDRRVAKR